MLSYVLSDKSIRKMISKGLLVTSDWSEEQIQPNSFDLRLDRQWKKTLPNTITNVENISDNIKMQNYSYMDTISKSTDLLDPIKDYKFTSGSFDMLPPLGNDCYYYDIQPKEFILMQSVEKLKIPNGIVAFVAGRSSVARLGVQIEQAGLIDAGFEGTITFEVFNENDYAVRLYAGMRIAQVYFLKAEKAKHTYGSDALNSKYQGQITPTISRINIDFNKK